jgi:hypothetical protein
VGGHIEASLTGDVEKLTTRLLSPEALSWRVVLFDNVKTHRVSNAALEALITSETVSGHRMFAGEGRRPNTITYAFTVNGGALSKDMSQRCIVIKLQRPTYSGNWESRLKALVEVKRWLIIADILATLGGPAKQVLTENSRWASWESEVLSRVNDPAGCQKLIKERQSALDDDEDERKVILEAFVEAVRLKQPRSNQQFFLGTREVVELLTDATGERQSPKTIKRLLKLYPLKGLTEGRGEKEDGYCRGYWFTKPKDDQEKKAA